MIDVGAAMIGRWAVAAGVAASLGGAPLDPPAIRLSAETTGGTFIHTVAPGDSLAALGARFGFDTQEAARVNGLRPGAPLSPGSALRFDNRHIVPVLDQEVALAVNVPQRTLFHVADGRTAAFPVGLGRRDWPTPLGSFTVIAKEENPTWDVPISIQQEMRREGRRVVSSIPPGPDNPLGAFWLRLSLGSVGVHGTNAPLSIYRHTTHGCIRLHPADIARLYPLVPVGASGRIVYEPVLLASTADGIFLEAHPDVYRRAPGSALLAVRDAAALAGLVNAIDWDGAGQALRTRAGVARRVDRPKGTPP